MSSETTALDILRDQVDNLTTQLTKLTSERDEYRDKLTEVSGERDTLKTKVSSPDAQAARIAELEAAVRTAPLRQVRGASQGREGQGRRAETPVAGFGVRGEGRRARPEGPGRSRQAAQARRRIRLRPRRERHHRGPTPGGSSREAALSSRHQVRPGHDQRAPCQSAGPLHQGATRAATAPVTQEMREPIPGSCSTNGTKK